MKAEFVNIEEETIGNLVADDYRKAEIFKRFGIDFCCGGGRTVRTACEKKGVNIDELKHELAKVEQLDTSSEGLQFNEWDLPVLIDYILKEHHAYVRASIPVMMEFVTKVARVHGHANPEVVEIARLVKDLAVDLEQHMMKEENILFPYIRHIVELKETGKSWERPPFGAVGNPIRMMEIEHEHAGDLLAEIRELSSNFTPPEHACTTYRVSYLKMEEFESNLHQHVHLENNILFPKAIAIEQNFLSAS